MTKEKIIARYPFLSDANITGYAFIRDGEFDFNFIEYREKESDVYYTIQFVYKNDVFCHLDNFVDSLLSDVLKDLFKDELLTCDIVKVINFK